MTNTQLQVLILILFLIIAIPAILKSIRQSIYNVYWHSQIAGDDFDEEGYCINQEDPYYLE